MPMRILALDLGNTTTKTYASFLDQDTGEILRTSTPTTPDGIHQMLDRFSPGRVVIEATLNTGWVADLVRGRSNIELQVAKPTDPVMVARRTCKNDRKDADLLLRLSASGQLATVIIPDAATRDRRQLIEYRTRLIRDRTRMKNRIRATLRKHGIPAGQLWNLDGHQRITDLSRSLDTCEPAECWRGILSLELARLDELEKHLDAIDHRLGAMNKQDPQVQKLLELPGIGERSAEAFVTALGDPLRFRNGKQVGAYFGLVPQIRQSGATQTTGSITKAGPATVRSLLIEVANLGAHRVDWMKAIYQHCLRDDPGRKHKAVTALARRIAVRCWAILRDQARAPNSGVTTSAV
jgi:transposase